MNFFSPKAFWTPGVVPRDEIVARWEEIAWPAAWRGKPVRVNAEDRRSLAQWVRAGTTPQRLVLRSRIVLLLADGLSNRAAARALGVSRHTVDLWRKRFEDGGCPALVSDKPGRGRKRGAVV
jgi:Homeodomain-like domain-containing protein